MRCDKMHATISVKQCLANQSVLVGIPGRAAKSLRYVGCKDCTVGVDARAGKLDDDDVRALFASLHAKACPPAETLPDRRTAAPHATAAKDEQIHEEMMAEEEKICSKCKEFKPVSRFVRESKGSEKRRQPCMDCIAAYHRDWMARRKKTEQVRHKEPRTRNEERMEPAPSQETPAPAMPQDDDRILENQLLLDFSCYPEVLEEIKRIAHDEERPLEVQARYMLKRVLRDGWGEARPCG